MPLRIRVDDLPAQEQQITLNGVTLFIRFSYSGAHTRDNWVMDILDQNKDNLLVGKRVTSTTNLTYHSFSLTEILDGYLFCVNTTATRTPMNRDNFGTDKAYQIWYYSNEEIEDGNT